MPLLFDWFRITNWTGEYTLSSCKTLRAVTMSHDSLILSFQTTKVSRKWLNNIHIIVSQCRANSSRVYFAQRSTIEIVPRYNRPDICPGYVMLYMVMYCPGITIIDLISFQSSLSAFILYPFGTVLKPYESTTIPVYECTHTAGT